MADFSRTKIDVQEVDQQSTSSGEIVKLDAENANKVIKNFEYSNINPDPNGDYQKVKSKYGPLAVTDRDRNKVDRHRSKFFINPMLRGPLSVEEEEKRVLAHLVEKQVEAIRDEERKKAHAEGFEAGRQEGFESAYREFKSDGSKRLEQFNHFIQSCENAKREIFQENEEFLLSLVYHVGKTVILRELKEDKEYIARLLRNLIERVGVKENLRVKLSAEDFKTAELLEANLKEVISDLKNVHFEMDEEIGLGGCILETSWHAIDAKIENQIRNVGESLTARKIEDPKKELQPEDVEDQPE